MKLLLPLAALLIAVPASAQVVVAPGSVWRSLCHRLRSPSAAQLARCVDRGSCGRPGEHGAEIAAEGILLDPDAAMTEPSPPPGDYRCRTIKIGARSEGLLNYVAYPAFKCRIESAGPEGSMGFTKLTGSQRPIGRFFADSARRMIFLGTNQLGDERGIIATAATPTGTWSPWSRGSASGAGAWSSPIRISNPSST